MKYSICIRRSLCTEKLLAMELNRTAPLDVVLVINLKQSSPLCAQSVMQRLHDAGHHVTLFGKQKYLYYSLLV